MMITSFEPKRIKDLYRPAAGSHKGVNGKLLVIGGSKLFHASIFWAALVASRIVDLVHFTSPAMENNELMRVKAKEKMWEGIVVPFEEVDKYIEEDEAILIGPGMPREDGLLAGERPTREIVKELLLAWPQKRWVVDGGALQELEPDWLTGQMIITPHQGEWQRLLVKRPVVNDQLSISDQLIQFSKEHQEMTILLKGEKDVVCRGEECVLVEGGNAGMTKGGTGDVLAGLVAALATKNEAWLAAQVGSFVNKKAGEALAEKVGIYFNANDLAEKVPEVLAGLVKD